MSPLHTTLVVYDQGHHPAFPINPNHHRPLISDAAGVSLSPLQLRRFLKNIRPDFRSEGVESEEVSGLPSEEVELSEQPLEGVLGEGLEWKERVVMLGTAGRGLK